MTKKYECSGMIYTLIEAESPRHAARLFREQYGTSPQEIDDIILEGSDEGTGEAIFPDDDYDNYIDGVKILNTPNPKYGELIGTL